MKNFEIFDVNRPIMERNPIIGGNSSRDALQKYLNDRGENVKFKRSSDFNCRFQVTPVIYKNEKYYRAGRCCWYAEIN